MRRKPPVGTAIPLFLLLFASASYAQNGDVYWHIDPTVESCSMVIDPSLTQAQWHKFAREAGAIMSYKSLAPATTLGRKNFVIAVEDGSTPVDQHDLAWINTFTHPDADCPLGDAISIPAIRGALGVSERMDIGAYWTSAPRANYGGVGAQLKYAFLRESKSVPTVAARASFSILTGVPDFNFNIYSGEIIASKQIAMLTPYFGFRESWLSATETTSTVNLERESLALPQGYVGLAYSVWLIDLAAEYNVSSVNTFAATIGFHH